MKRLEDIIWHQNKVLFLFPFDYVFSTWTAEKSGNNHKIFQLLLDVTCELDTLFRFMANIIIIRAINSS